MFIRISRIELKKNLARNINNARAGERKKSHELWGPNVNETRIVNFRCTGYSIIMCL